MHTVSGRQGYWSERGDRGAGGQGSKMGSRDSENWYQPQFPLEDEFEI